MNLKRTRGDLLLRREKHVSTISGGTPGIEWSKENNISQMSQVQPHHASEDRLAKRAELLSQLPASTKVETVLKVEPTESGQHDMTSNLVSSLVGGNKNSQIVDTDDLGGNSTSAPFSSFSSKVNVLNTFLFYLSYLRLMF